MLTLPDKNSSPLPVKTSVIAYLNHLPPSVRRWHPVEPAMTPLSQSTRQTEKSEKRRANDPFWAALSSQRHETAPALMWWLSPGSV